jgi:hypothetical protein
MEEKHLEYGQTVIIEKREQLALDESEPKKPTSGV